MRFYSLMVTLLVLYTDVTHGVINVNNTIEFLFNMNDQPGDGYRIGLESPTFPAFARNAQKICVYGMWALYNNEDYGTNFLSNTTSIAVKGTGINDCTTTSVAYIIRTIRSLRPLVPDLKPDTLGCVYWKTKNFIGPSVPELTAAPPTTCTIAATDEVRSLAIPEPKTPPMVAKLVPKSGTCVCVDLSRGPFLMSDYELFPTAEKPIGQIMTVMFQMACLPADLCTIASVRYVNNIFPSIHIE